MYFKAQSEAKLSSPKAKTDAMLKGENRLEEMKKILERKKFETSQIKSQFNSRASSMLSHH